MNSTHLLKITSFVSGFVIMSLETLAFRLLAPYFGSSVYVSGSLLGVVMCALAVGYRWGGNLADRYPSEKVIYSLLGVTSIWVLFLILFQRLFFPFAANLGIIQGSLFSTFIVLGIPILPLSMTSPYVIRILGDQKKLGSIAGTIYAISTFGSLAGVFSTTFWLIPYCGVRITLVCNFVLLVLMSTVGFSVYKRKFLFGLLVLLLAFVPEIQTPDKALVESRESLYGLVQVRSPRPPVIVMKINEGGGQSHYDPRNKYPYEYNYRGVFALLPKIFDRPPERFLLMGEGGGTIASAWQLLFPSTPIDIVEINPVVDELAKKYFNFKPVKETRTHLMDARQFLIQTDHQYDFAVLDTFQGFSTPYHLSTEDFFLEISQHLTDQGILGINLFAPYHDVANRLCTTLRNVYSNVYILPSYLYGAILIAVKSDISSLDIAKRLVALNRSPEFSPQRQDSGQSLSKSLNYLQKNLFECGLQKRGGVFTDDLSDFDVLYFQSVMITKSAEQSNAESMELFKEGLRNWPGNPASHFGIAQNFLDEKKRDLAFEEYNKVSDEKFNIDLLSTTFMSEELLMRKEYSRAEKILRSALPLWSAKADMQGLWGRLLFHKGKYRDAVGWLEKSTKQSKSRSKNFEYLGDVYLKTNQRSKAKQAYEQAKEVFKQEIDNEERILLLQANLSEIEEKEKQLKKS